MIIVIKMFWWIFIILPLCWKIIECENIFASRVFVIPIGPGTFHLNSQVKGIEFSYQASLLNSPDLPSWIHYTYSNKHRLGFLYGVAPKEQEDFQLEIVALNKKTYETSYKVLNMSVSNNENLLKYEVSLKVDNLNIEDTFDGYRLQNLLDLFRTELWKKAQDLYVSYLVSAVEEGARLPLNPEEPEGVVIRLGSSVPFSHTLIDFEKELEPLRKRSPCPKDFKKTSKEKLFREARFLMDWCSFQLIAENPSLNQESARQGSSMKEIDRKIIQLADWHWSRPKKSEIPTRSYFNEIAITVFLPTSLLLVLAILLSTTFCLHHEKANDPESDRYFNELFNIFHRKKNNDVKRESPKREPSPVEGVSNNEVQMVQYATSERGTLRSLAVQPISPIGSLERSPRVSAERCNPYIRPNPPPYTAPKTFGSLSVDL